jgi:peptide/nickel transport system substrate-binding protein
VAYDEKMAIVPALAAAWSSPDEYTWEFALRSGVLFHPGGTVTPQDVVFSIERARSHPRSVLKNALVDVTSVQAASGGRVVLRTGQPDAYLLARLRDVFVVSRREVELRGDAAFASASCGTGPYRIASRERDTLVDLSRFDGYWRGAAEVPRLRFLARSYGGQDYRSRVPPTGRIVFRQLPTQRAFASARREAEMYRLPSLSVAYLGFDLQGATTPRVRLPDGGRKNPFLDPRVRTAIALALDTAAFRKEALADSSYPASQLVPRGVFGFEPELQVRGPDVPAARRLLGETPFAGGFEVELDVRTLIPSAGPVLVKQLAGIGIVVKVNALPEAEFFARLSAHDSSLYVLSFSCRSGDAQELLDRWLHSKDAASGLGEANQSYDVSPVPGLDQAIDAARRDIVPSRRLLALQAVMRRAMEARLALPLFQYEDVTFASREIEWHPRLDSYRLAFGARFREGVR